MSISIPLKSKLRNSRKNLAKWALKKRLINQDFTIISNNCWGGEVYRDLGLPYKSPFVGLFLFSPCYIRLLNNLKPHLESELTFTSVSRYEFANKQREQEIWEPYPIGLLGDDIEIHFMHYSSAYEAREKWFRRLERINWDERKLFFKFCDRELCTEELIADFNQLDFSNKVCFTSKNYPDFKSNIWIKECSNEPCVFDGGSLYSVCRNYFDVIDWLNGGSGYVKFTQKIINKVFY